MKIYTVERQPAGVVCIVTENDTDKELKPRLDLIPYSEHFSFNHIQGTSQLALALLADCFGDDDDRAIELHEWFRDNQVALWAGKKFTITSDEILRIASKF